MPTVFEMMQARTSRLFSLGEYAPIRSAYSLEVGGIISEYLTATSVRITRFRNMFKKAVLEAFYPAYELGLKDGGGEAPAQGEDLEWINAKVESEFGNIDSLFVQLKDLKALVKEEGPSVLVGVAAARAEGYARTLDNVYSQGKVRGAANKMLTFVGEDGQENCPTCRKLKGKRHRASWWRKHGLIIERGNINYECGCWNCQHTLIDDKGEIFTA